MFGNLFKGDPLAQQLGLSPKTRKKSGKKKFTAAQKKTINKIKARAYKAGRRASRRRRY